MAEAQRINKGRLFQAEIRRAYGNLSMSVYWKWYWQHHLGRETEGEPLTFRRKYIWEGGRWGAFELHLPDGNLKRHKTEETPALLFPAGFLFCSEQKVLWFSSCRHLGSPATPRTGRLQWPVAVTQLPFVCSKTCGYAQFCQFGYHH